MNIKNVFKKLFNYFGYEIIRKPRVMVLVSKGLEINYGWMVHFLYFKELFDKIKPLEGDIVECGVGFGRTFYQLCCLAQLENGVRRIYGFDSFEGFPEPSKEDGSIRNPKKGQWNIATVEMVGQLLREGGIGSSFIASKVKIIKGYFEESLHQYDGGKIAFLHLDVDLYQSYKVTLEYFWSKVVKGGVVLFDEYKQPECLERFPGASKAIDEFFGDLVSQIQYHQQANRFYIIKK